MNDILSEKEYQKYIMERLEADNGYIIRSANKYDRLHAMDREILIEFLNKTQPKAVEKLKKSFKADFTETLINLSITK